MALLVSFDLSLSLVLSVFLFFYLYHVTFFKSPDIAKFPQDCCLARALDFPIN